MLVIGAELKSTKMDWLLRPKEGGRGMYNNKMALARLKKIRLMMAWQTNIGVSTRNPFTIETAD